MPTTLRLATLTIVLLAGSGLSIHSAGAAPRVTHHPNGATANFAERWSWGAEQARQSQRGGWIGYAVDIWMDPDSYLLSGGFSMGRGGKIFKRGVPLDELLGDRTTASLSPGVVNSQRPGQLRRTVAVLVMLDSQGQIHDVDVTDIGFPADLGGLPLAWIGPASADESFRLVTRLYDQAERAEAKEDVVEAVSLHDRAEAVDFLARVLGSEVHEETREEAAEALAELSDPRSLDLLVRTARQDRSLEVREEAVEALGESRVDGAEAAVIELARHGESRRVREEAVEVLAELATPIAFETIRDILWNDSDAEVQEEALEALADRGGDDALALLIEVARHHPKTAIRQEAVEGLAEMAADRVVGTLEDLAYSDSNPAVREEALDALGELSGGEGIPALVKVASTHPDRAMREEALDVLADASEDQPRARRALEMMGSN